MLLKLQTGVVYGPVRSRRLGRSLGINVLPPGRKVCTFDCLYCQYGWTDGAWLARTPRPAYPSVKTVLKEVEAALRALGEAPQFLTFSGHGEATMHPDFPELVDGVARLRDALAPGARTAILSNSTRVGDAVIRAALARLDARIMKLDAGTDRVCRRFNQPVVPLVFGEIVAGLRALGDVTLQSLFCEGPDGNLGPDDVDAWLAAVRQIEPRDVQLYTLDRDAPSDRLAPAPPARLAGLAAQLGVAGVAAEVY